MTRFQPAVYCNCSNTAAWQRKRLVFSKKNCAALATLELFLSGLDSSFALISSTFYDMTLSAHKV